MNFTRIDFTRVVRDCGWNADPKNSRDLIYDFAVIVDGVRLATWERGYGKGYDLVDLNSDPILTRGATEDDYNPERNLRATVERKADFESETAKLLCGDRIPSLAEQTARLEGWGRALLEEREIADAKRQSQARAENATALYDAVENLLVSKKPDRKFALELLAKIDLRAKEMIDFDREHAAPNDAERAAIEAFTATLSRRVA